MSKILANQIANYGDDSPIELKEGLNIPASKPLQAAGESGSSGQVLTSTGSTVQWTTPFDGSYNSLTNLPTIPAAQVNSDWNAVGTVAEILNKPLVPPLPSVTVAAAGSSSLSYNSTSGLFTYTPPDLSEYATEAWVGSQGYLTTYTETDTLATVTGRGASTDTAITAGGGITIPYSSGSNTNNRLKLGNNDELQIFHNLADSHIGHNGTGSLKITVDSGSAIVFEQNSNTVARFGQSGFGVELYYGNVVRLETSSSGVSLAGDLTTTGKLYYSNNFATTGDLPDASTYHGMFAHVHAEGHGYFAHAGGWTQLLDTGSELGDLANVNFATAPQTGQVLKYDGSNWVAAADGTGGGGIALSDLSVSTTSAGSAALSYNNVSGVFTFTPPDLSSYLTSVAINDVSDVNITSLADTEILRYNSVSGNWENWAPNYLTSYTETDPVFVASPAGSITNADINQWDTAYGWGNHANGGYLVATAQDKTNWNTAYGWGDHAAAGYSTLPSQDTNVVIGDATTGDAITTAVDNVVIGSNAGSAITTNDYNVFVGHNAGAADIGSLNVAIGPEAGDTSYGEFQNVENVAVGRLAGDLRNGNGNTALGFAALSSTATSGFSFGNIALGYYAMGNYRIDGASYNTCIGQQTGYNLSSGDANVFLGDYAGYGITTGSNNVLIGTSAGDDITTGANNVIINGGNYQNGTTSGFTTTTSNSLWIGHSSYAWITGASSGNTRTVTIPGQLTAGGLTYPTTNGSNGEVLTSDGSGNVVWAAGGSGGANVTISDTAPGSAQAGDLWWESDKGRLKIYYNDTDSTQWVDASPPLADATSIGGSGTVAMLASLIPDTNDAYDLGNAEYKIRDIYEANPSDARLKTDVVDYTGGLAFVESLRVVDFTWKEDVAEKAGKRETGLIAQEVKEALDASNYNSWRLHTDGDTQGVDKKQLIPALISAIQELSARVKELENK